MGILLAYAPPSFPPRFLFSFFFLSSLHRAVIFQAILLSYLRLNNHTQRGGRRSPHCHGAQRASEVKEGIGISHSRTLFLDENFLLRWELAHTGENERIPVVDWRSGGWGGGYG